MTSLLGRPGAARITAAALAGLALLPAAASAADVTASKLGWSIVNQYDTTFPANTNRTWLGYVLNSGAGPQFSNGTAAVTDGATLGVPAGWVQPSATPTTIDGTAPEGLDKVYTFGFPGNTTGRGTFDPATGKGELEFTGTLTFTTHTLPVTIVNPKVTLDGTTGTLAASGQGMTAPYTRDTPVFTLNLSDATVVGHPDGSETVSGIVPTSAQTGVFGAAYAAGVAGPNRSPNTFGSFSIRLAVPAPAPILATPVTGPAGAQGPAGPQGPKGETGVAGASSDARSYVLAKAPFGAKAVTVTVLTKKGYALTVGTVKGKTLKVRRSLSKGTYKLQRTNRFVKQRTASIKVG